MRYEDAHAGHGGGGAHGDEAHGDEAHGDERGEIEVREGEVHESVVEGDGERGSVDRNEARESVDGHDAREDERLRALLTEAPPEFAVTSALGDRALAGAARRRTRTRIFGGTGAVAVLAVGVLAVAPLAGWGGHGSHGAVAGDAPKVSVTSTSPTPTPTPTPTPSPSSSSPTHLTPPPRTGPTTKVTIPAWVNGPKMKAVERVTTALQSGHDNSFMGVGLSGQNYINDTQDSMAASATDWSPIVVYRKPVSDPTLEQTAIHAAAPYTVVFRDTVLNASEQWFLGHRLYQDQAYWKGRGVRFLTSLQENGTITIATPDPGTTLPLLEQYYGYDGRVFVGQKWPFPSAGSVTPPAPSSTGN